MAGDDLIRKNDHNTAESSEIHAHLLADSGSVWKGRAAKSEMVTEPLASGLDALVDAMSKQSSPRGQGDFWTKLSGLFHALQSGQRANSNQFDSVFGATTASLLRKCGIQSVQESDKAGGQHHFVLTFSSAGNDHMKNSTIKHDRSIEFDVSEKNGHIVLSNVKGLKVSKDGLPGTATVDTIETYHEQNGDVVINGTGHWMWMNGSKKIVFDSDGNLKTSPA